MTPNAAKADTAVDVVVVAYNSGRHSAGVAPLAGCPWLDVVVVDNASTDDSRSSVVDLPLEVLAQGENLGFAAPATSDGGDREPRSSSS